MVCVLLDTINMAFLSFCLYFLLVPNTESCNAMNRVHAKDFSVVMVVVVEVVVVEVALVVVLVVVLVLVVDVGPNSSAGLGQRLRCRQLRASHRPDHSCPVQAIHLDPLLCTLTSCKSKGENRREQENKTKEKKRKKKKKRLNHSCPLLAAFPIPDSDHSCPSVHRAEF